MRESRIVSRLLLEKHGQREVLDRVMSRNLFQNSSKATIQKYCQLALIRLDNLTNDQLRLVASGSEDIARLTLFVAVLKTYPIIADFIEGVVAEKVRCFETHLEKSDWTRFLEVRANGDPEVLDWSEKSRHKMGQVVVRMLAEAGFLDNTRRMTIRFPAIPLELERSLLEPADSKLLACMKLGR